MQTNQEQETTQETSVAAAPNPLERRLDMSVSLEAVEKDVAQRLKKMSRTVKMPGFRPGKVPMNMVAQQYGHQARSEAIGEAVEKSFNAAVHEQKLRVAGYPNFEPKEGAAAGQMSFSAVFEVYPEITLGEIAGREIAKPTLTVTDAEVDKTLEVLRKQRTTFVEAAKAAADGDRAIIDFIGRRDGEPFPGGQASDFAMLVGGGQMLPDFETAVLGMSAGETKTFDLTFPEDYQAKDLAGQTVQFELTLKRVDAPELPPLDADFARALGIADGDVEKMRGEVKDNLTREVNNRLKARTKAQAMEALLAANPVDVPQALVRAESGRMAQATIQDMEARGMSTKNVPIQPAWFTEQAQRRVRLSLIVSELAREKDLYAKPEQVRAVIEEFAATYEDPAEVVRWYYSQPQRLAEAESLALENNVVEWVLANAKVSEKPASFDELMEVK
ncbi:peptidyl-prolyl cis/trans isomerase (trigger factor) [Sterolibacterium denitrificans]|uniref:Trigger factor n=1 Tax=Sterolibacterium denitrificans TaxID=157592 RepID=A0A7Z7HRM7_9PROT|nr:trigger factor [Sterolibacterium denitrificans]SMB27827.1 peptidyl-prolyl cis/trans isomerase (trigger factor) [Sterolibacterium denitrificans]